MIDLHCHILPGIDDGASDLAMSLSMARLAVADGITGLVCTPHITPGLYDNSTENIARAIDVLRLRLADCAIALDLFMGADIHLAPDLGKRLSEGDIPSLNRSCYFLLEPPHHVAPPQFLEFCRGLLISGLHPILTHPERLTWIEGQYHTIDALVRAGVLVQLTAGSVIGHFGKRPRYWAERMLDEGRVDFMATDAHNALDRPPILAKARDVVAARCGDVTAQFFVQDGPALVLNNMLLPKRKIRSVPNYQHKPVTDWMRKWMGKSGS